jgi:hypothetical protein
MREHFVVTLVAGLLLSFALLPAALGQANPEELLPIEQGLVEPLAQDVGDFSLRVFPDRPSVDHLRPPVPMDVFLQLKEEARFSKAEEVAPLSSEDQTGLVVPESLTINRSYAGLDRPSNPNNPSPPDTTLAKSGFRVLQAVNRTVQLRQPGGGVLDTQDLTAFFGATTTGGFGQLFDPKVYFDRLGANFRLYVVALQKDSLSPRGSRIWLAVSRSSNPNNLSSSSWCRYQINALRDAGTSLESWADYPGLGGGKDALVVTTNQFTFGNSFTYALVWAIDKEPLADNAGSCPSLSYSVFQPESTSGNFDTFTLQPADHVTAPSSFSGTTNPAYLVSTHWSTGNTYRIWRLRNVASGSPSLQVVDWSSGFTYGLQPDAPQNGSTPNVDTGDNRVTQVSARGDQLWSVHATVCNVGGGGNESCVRMAQFDVSQTGGGLPSVSPGEQVTINGANGEFFYFPGIAVNNSRTMGVALQKAGTSSFLSVAYWVKAYLVKVLVIPQNFLTGNCVQQPEPGFTTTRSGDYTGAQTNPNDQVSFWLSGEAARNLSGSCLWATQIVQITP